MTTARIKSLARRLSDAERRWSRRLPAIKTGHGGTPTIYYLCPDHQLPSGGVRAIYRHVDLLNDSGVSAAVMHHREGFSVRWFSHETRIVGARSTVLSPDDVLVVPEIYGPSMHRLPDGPRRVVFNQNAYLTFDDVPTGHQLPYHRFDAVLTVSRDSADYLRFAFPGLVVSTVRNSIDPTVFFPADNPDGKKLSLMPRKRPHDAAQVLRLLGDRLAGWEVATIDGDSEATTAETMRSSAIFLTFGRQEGFGLPAAEAMASGCYVIGFHGFGGRELLDPSFSVPVADGDVLAFAQAVATALGEYGAHPEKLRAAGRRAHEHVRETYSIEKQRDDLLECFQGTAPCAS